MTISFNKLVKFFNGVDKCFISDVANVLFRNKKKPLRLEGCRVYVSHNKHLYNTQVYSGIYEIDSDFEYTGSIKSYPDSTTQVEKKIKTGLDSEGKLMRESLGNDYNLYSEMAKKSLEDCNNRSKPYIIEKREVIENFNKRKNCALYVLSSKNGNIKIIYDENYNIESIAMFIDPKSSSESTFDVKLNMLVENILRKVSTWDNKEKRFKNKNNYDEINSEVEIIDLVRYLKKYH